MDKSKELSDVITFLRFPLIVGVVMVHTHLSADNSADWYDYYTHIIGSMSLISPAVFFIISSYLFFYKGFSLPVYKDKLKRRVDSLLVPYLIWNLLYLLFILAIQTFFPSLIGEGRKAVADYTLGEFLNSFWNFGGMYYGMPVLYAFWFIRDLLVINLFAPVVFFLIRKLDLFVILLLAVLFVVNPFNLPATGLDWVKAVLFYFIGAYFAIKGRLIFDLGKCYLPIIIIAAILLFFPVIYKQIVFGSRVLFLFLAVAVPAILLKCVTSHLVKPSPRMAQASFFVYALHLFVIEGACKFWQLLFSSSCFSTAIGRVMVPLCVSFFCVGIYYILNKLFPKTMSVLTGGR